MTEFAIRVRDAYQNNLKGISVDIAFGELVCITGVSGSGKSTFIEHCVGKLAQHRHQALSGKMLPNFYEDDTSEVRSELNSLPGIGFELQGYTPGDSLDSASVGVSHQLTRDLSLRGGYSYSQSDEQSQQGVSVSLALDW